MKVVRMFLLLVFIIWPLNGYCESLSSGKMQSFLSCGKTQSCLSCLIPEKIAFARSLAIVTNPRLKEDVAEEIARAVVSASMDERFKRWFTGDEAFFLILGLITQESHFNPKAASGKKAVGLMQIHLPTWKVSMDYAQDIFMNVFYGKEILLHYLKLADGNLAETLYRYYGRRSRAYASNVLGHALQYAIIFEGYIDHLRGTSKFLSMR